MRRYFSAEVQVVHRVSAEGVRAITSPSESGRLTLAVKGNHKDLEGELQWTLSNTLLSESPALRAAQPTTQMMPGIRRGWDALHPWTELEARGRADHYWSISPEVLVAVQGIVKSDGADLLLMVKDPRGRTTEAVVRYAWSIADTEWIEYGPSWGKGIPLQGDQIPDHLLLGKILKYRTAEGGLRGIAHQHSPAYFWEHPTRSSRPEAT